MHVRVGLWRRLSAVELMRLNCGAGENSWESLGLQGDPTIPFWRRSALGFFGRTDAKGETPVTLAISCEGFTHSLEKTLMLGGIAGRRRRGQQRMRWLNGITDLMDVSLSELRKLVMDRENWHTAIHGVAKRRTWLSDWIELNWIEDLSRGMYSHVWKNIPRFDVTVFLCQSLWHSQIGVDVFLEFSCFLENPTCVDNLILWSSAL